MGNIDKKVLKNIYQASKMGLDSVEYIYPKVEDKELRKDLDEYKRKYHDIIGETKYRLDLMKAKPEDYSPMIKVMLWTGIQTQTMMDTSSSHIAELLIKGSSKGIVEMTKDVNNDLADENVRKIANTLIHYEKENIDKMKKYL